MPSLLTDLQKTRKLTPEEEQDNKDVVNDYNQKKSMLTDRKKENLKETEQIKAQKNKKPKKKSVSKTQPSHHLVYV